MKPIFATESEEKDQLPLLLIDEKDYEVISGILALFRLYEGRLKLTIYHDQRYRYPITRPSHQQGLYEVSIRSEWRKSLYSIDLTVIHDRVSMIRSSSHSIPLEYLFDFQNTKWLSYSINKGYHFRTGVADQIKRIPENISISTSNSDFDLSGLPKLKKLYIDVDKKLFDPNLPVRLSQLPEADYLSVRNSSLYIDAVRQLKSIEIWQSDLAAASCILPTVEKIIWNEASNGVVLNRYFPNVAEIYTVYDKLDGSLWGLSNLKKADTYISSSDLLTGLLKNTGLEFLKIRVSDTRIKKLPDEFYDLENLKVCDIAEIGLEVLDKRINNLRNLRALNLYKNKLQDFPELGDFSFLKELNIGATIDSAKLGGLPDLSHLKRLQYLRLSYCMVEKIPDWIGELGRLEYLDFSANQFKILPDEICQLKRLKYLDFSITKLQVLPEWICELKNLKTLKITYPAKEGIPEGLWELKNLKRLVIWGKKMTEFPVQVMRLENLKLLDIRETEIESVPSILNQHKKLKFVFVNGDITKPETGLDLRLYRPNHI